MPNVFNISLDQLNPFMDKLMQMTAEVAPRVTVELLNYMGVAVQRIWVNELYDAPSGSRKGWGIKAAETLKIDMSGAMVRVYADEEEIDERSGQKKILFMNIIEDGINSWSIKDALLASKRAKTNRLGEKYIHVPLRYRVPGAQKKHTYFQGVMKNDIYNIVNGGKSSLKGAEYGNMAGLAKVGREGHAGYMVFRTVSKQSQGWQYPNISPTPVYEKVLKQVEEMIPSVLENFCKAFVEKIGKEAK